MAWEFGSYRIQPHDTIPVYITWNGYWQGPQFMQAKPNAWATDTIGNPIFIMDQAVVTHGSHVQPGGTIKSDYDYGCDVHNPSNKWLDFKMTGGF